MFNINNMRANYLLILDNYIKDSLVMDMYYASSFTILYRVYFEIIGGNIFYKHDE